MQSHSFIWIKVLGKVRQKVDPRVYDIYFMPTSSKGIDDVSRILEIAVPNSHFSNWLNQNYRGVLREALEESGYRDYRIRFVAENDGDQPVGARPSRAEKSPFSKTSVSSNLYPNLPRARESRLAPRSTLSIPLLSESQTGSPTPPPWR